MSLCRISAVGMAHGAGPADRAGQLVRIVEPSTMENLWMTGTLVAQ